HVPAEHPADTREVGDLRESCLECLESLRRGHEAEAYTGVSYDGGGGCHLATSDPIAEIIGDYRAFAAMQRDRLVARGIDISPYALSQLAVRVADWDIYVHQRTLLERHARANSEDVWNGRQARSLRSPGF